MSDKPTRKSYWFRKTAIPGQAEAKNNFIYITESILSSDSMLTPHHRSMRKKHTTDQCIIFLACSAESGCGTCLTVQAYSVHPWKHILCKIHKTMLPYFKMPYYRNTVRYQRSWRVESSWLNRIISSSPLSCTFIHQHLQTFLCQLWKTSLLFCLQELIEYSRGIN